MNLTMSIKFNIFCFYEETTERPIHLKTTFANKKYIQYSTDILSTRNKSSFTVELFVTKNRTSIENKREKKAYTNI